MNNELSSWINLPRYSDEYAKRVEDYLDNAFSTRADGDQISCPCKVCYHRYWHHRGEVYNHLIAYGIGPEIGEWHYNEKGISSMSNTEKNNDNFSPNKHDDMESLLYDTHRDLTGEVNDDVEPEAKKFFKLLEDGKQELYPGCKSFTKLSFIIRLYLYKCINGLTNTAFSELLEIIKDLIPDAKLPESFNEARKLVKDLGLHYQKIDACRNDCMLFWKDHINATSCHVCHSSRWKEVEKQQNNDENPSSQHGHQVPAKVVWHFPLKPRLQRLYMCSETANYMRWHDEKRPKDGNLRHPADGKAWQDFASLYPQFSQDPRNVRLGLASDGFNPFRTMSTNHSTWPVVLINYNLPPWLFMKREYLILSLLIPGPLFPGNDIDIYLQPLIEELNELWEFGLETYDISKGQSFQMHAVLQSTTSDFPGYAMLSGWSTKGRYACPYCHYETDHLHLKHSKKSCYMGHRRFLDANHRWRRDKSFNGEIEKRAAPDPLTGDEILELLQNFENKFGKKQPKRRDETCPWRKKSFFFRLPYWKHITSRHHLDAMHIEKNICDSILGTLLDIPGKTKDHLNARLDLQEMGIKKPLQPLESSDKRCLLLPKASFSMTKEEKTLFCNVLKKAKLPQGCASNIARCVQVQERKISGYKSHDAHILMQYLLQVAVRKTLPKHVALGLIRLSAFFRAICNKAINPQDLDHLQCEIVEILCIFEKIFPPSFFDIMIHLPIHLVNEVRLSGPAGGWWMYPIERYLGILKSYVRNRSRPEGSIAEGYLAEECLVFCSRYLHDGLNKRSKRTLTKGNEDTINEKSPIFPKMGYPLGKRKNGKRGMAFSLDSESMNQAHRYVLFNCEDQQVQKYILEHEDLMKNKFKDKQRKTWRSAQQHSKEFMVWFKKKVELDQVPDHIKWLSFGPCSVARRYIGYSINGYKYYTRERDAKRKTQNSGVTLSALTSSFASSKDHNPILDKVTYYGAIQEIIELDYWGSFNVILFRCDWFHVEKDKYGLTRVNFNKLCYVNDPFILASQVHQVFYVEDPIEEGWHYVMKKFPVEFFNLEGQMEDTYLANPTEFFEDRIVGMAHDDYDNDATGWCREGVPPTVVEMGHNTIHIEPPTESHDNSSDLDDTYFE